MDKYPYCSRCKWQENKVEPCCWCADGSYLVDKDITLKEYLEEAKTMDMAYIDKVIAGAQLCAEGNICCERCPLFDIANCRSKIAEALITLRQELIDERDRNEPDGAREPEMLRGEERCLRVSFACAQDDGVNEDDGVKKAEAYLAEKHLQTAKADAGKPKLTMVPREIIRAIAAVREYGNNKYGDPENWRTVEVERYRDAAYRHWLAYLDDPYGVDAESGLPHLWHLACNVAFLIELEG